MSVFVRRSSVLVALCALLVFAIAAASASAKTYKVTKKGDPAPGKCKKHNCSLREAVIAANKHKGKDTISLPASKGAYKLTRKPPAHSDENKARKGDLDLTDKTAVKHSGKGRATVDANKIDRVFDVQNGAKSSFKKLAITGGKAVGPKLTPRPATARRGGLGPAAEGGGIRNAATITVRSSVIRKNRSLQYGGGIGVIDHAGLKLIGSMVTHNTSPTDGGGIDGASGKTTIKHSKVTDNKAQGDGGGMYFYSSGTSTILDSTFSGNEATGNGDGGGIESSGNPVTAPKLKATGSTFSGNRASSNGGGINIDGSTLIAENSTFAQNTAVEGGGGIRDNAGIVHLNSVSVVGNESGAATLIIQLLGGGLDNQGPANSFTVENSLVALNFSGTTRNDCFGDFGSNGHNLLGTDTSCTGFDQPGDLIKPNPKVGKLKSNGGPTKTIALQKGSPAIGKAKKSSAPKHDQRGHKRDKHPDIGAFER